jgi:hypothetical protein
VLGCLGGVGTMLTMWLMAPGLSPALQRKRQELRERLETLAGSELRGSTQESPRTATEAPLERV